MTFKKGEGRAPVDLRGESNGGWTIKELVGAELGHSLWAAKHKCGRTSNIRADHFTHRPPKYCTHCRPAVSPGRYRSKKP
jgi:predicted dienelactone hydrolase